MSRLETKDLDVRVAIDKTLLGWLCAITGLTPKMAMCHLYDMCDSPLSTLKAKNGSWSSKRVKFPSDQVDIVLQVKASRYYDRAQMYKDYEAWVKRSEKETGIVFSSGTPQSWLAANPNPYRDNHSPKYNYIKCKFALAGKDKEIVMSQDEMETLTMETIILGADDGEN